jgi:SAM-dependent methyltransferase
MIKEALKRVLAVHKCTVCGNKVYKFTPVSPEYIRNLRDKDFPIPVTDFETLNYSAYKCPFCQANDRDRLMALYLQKKVFRQAGKEKLKVLDLAPAEAFRQFLRQSPEVTYRSADLFMNDVDDKVDIQNMSIYKDNTFDVIICSHILEHVPDDRQSLRELYRVLRPGGSCLLMVPIPLGDYPYEEDLGNLTPEERERRFGQDDHVRLYTKKIWEERISAAGFILEKFSLSGMGTKEAATYGIAQKSVLYVGKKQA